MSKQDALNAIAALPDTVSMEDIMYQLYLINCVQQGLADIQAGRTYTTDQVQEMLSL